MCNGSGWSTVTLIFNATPQMIAQRCQNAAPKWPNDISSAAGNAIFKNRAQNIMCWFGCVARCAVLLKPNVANILLFSFCEQKFVQYGLITIAIYCNGLSLLICQEKWPNYASGPKSASNSDSFWVLRLFNVCLRGFLCPIHYNVGCLHTRQDQWSMSFIWKDDFFFAKIGIVCKSICGNISQRCSSVNTTIAVNNTMLNKIWLNYYQNLFLLHLIVCICAKKFIQVLYKNFSRYAIIMLIAAVI